MCIPALETDRGLDLVSLDEEPLGRPLAHVIVVNVNLVRQLDLLG
jgi:hypothetical protein